MSGVGDARERLSCAERRFRHRDTGEEAVLSVRLTVGFADNVSLCGAVMAR